MHMQRSRHIWRIVYWLVPMCSCNEVVETNTVWPIPSTNERWEYNQYMPLILFICQVIYCIHLQMWQWKTSHMSGHMNFHCSMGLGSSRSTYESPSCNWDPCMQNTWHGAVVICAQCCLVNLVPRLLPCGKMGRSLGTRLLFGSYNT